MHCRLPPPAHVRRVNCELGLASGVHVQNIHQSMVTIATEKENDFHPMRCRSIMMDGIIEGVEEEGRRGREEVGEGGREDVGER